MGAKAVEEAFLHQPEWAARERQAPTGPEGKGELETRRKWPKSRVSARKWGFGPEEGGGRREVGKRRRGKTRKRLRA